MKTLFILLALLVSVGFEANATSVCITPPFDVAFAKSSSVVAATAVAISTKKTATGHIQTILWAVNESWKGAHYKRGTFTTRNTWVAPVAKGQPWLLYLTGREPYPLRYSPCDRSQPLQDALPDVRRLYKAN